METKTCTKWEIGKTVTIANDKRIHELCSDGVLYVYESIEQALATKVSHGYNSDNQLRKGESKMIQKPKTRNAKDPKVSWYVGIYFIVEILLAIGLGLSI